MFFQKANPHHDPKTGRFTTGPRSARSAASASTSYGAAYSPAKTSILNADGSLNINAAKQIADNPDIAYSIPDYQDYSLVAGREIQGFNGSPHLVKPAEFDSLTGDTLYRGDIKAEYCKELTSGTFRGGKGTYGNGTYSAKNITEAAAYADRYNPNTSADRAGGIIRFKMHPSARIAKQSDGENSIGMHYKRIMPQIESAERAGTLNPTQAKTLRIHLRDDGRMATALGFDAFVPTGAYDHVVVLNRTAMIIADESHNVQTVLEAHG